VSRKALTVSRKTLAVDAGIGVLVLGLTLPMLAKGGLGTPGPGARALDGLGVLLAAASALPVAARRLTPLTAYAVAAGAGTALLGLAYPFDAPLGPVVAAYGLAEAYGGDPRTGRRWTALLAAAAFVPVTAALYAAGGVDVRRLAPELLLWALVFAGAWVTGDRTRLRRERIEELEERARRAQYEAERERRLAAAEERTRIARELHDSAGHAINVILVQAGAARLLHQRDPDGSVRAITIVEEVARDTIGEIDRLVRALRDDNNSDDNSDDSVAEPPTPVDPATLDELVERHRAAGLDVAADRIGRRRPLPPGVAWAVYRILQESLTNAARHGCGSADLVVRFDSDAVEITVTNPTARTGPVPSGGGGHDIVDGHGISGGHGIVGMRERASLLGGTLSADVEQGIFRLYARLPFNGTAP
jgi:signal transduction histidine kinase